jgi:hypothetical protein
LQTIGIYAVDARDIHAHPVGYGKRLARMADINFILNGFDGLRQSEAGRRR